VPAETTRPTVPISVRLYVYTAFGSARNLSHFLSEVVLT
jgi:hypothetical protein